MEKLKDIKTKHNHTLTDILKILIFSLVMLAPFGAVISKCLYTTFNKNAKDSYSGNYEITYKYQSNQVNSIDDLVVGNIYQLNCEGKTISNLVQQGEYVYFELLNDLQFTSELTFEEVVENAITKFDSHMLLMFIDDTINIYSSQDDKDDRDYYLSFSYENTFANNPIIRLLDYDLEYYTYYTYTDYNEIESVNLTGTLDNGFYYAVNELSEQPLFSWTINTFIYSTINQMTSGLDFGNDNVLALLLTYWILNTMIYIIFDIVIEIFKKLTHAFN